MGAFQEYKALLREKSGKKLAALSVIVFLVITVIVFFAVIKLCENTFLKQMDEYLGEIPKFIDSINEELDMRSRIFEDDALARAEIGLKIYEEENALSDAEKLELVRSAVSAASVSLLDDQRVLLSTTGADTPEENFSACIQKLEPREPYLELYSANSEDGKETGKSDGRGFVLLPVPGDVRRNLVFEFDCDTLVALYNDIEDSSRLLAEMRFGGDAIVFARTDDKVSGYPLDDNTSEEIAQIYGEIKKVFQNKDSFRKAKNGRSSKLLTLLGERFLAAMMYYSQEAPEILLTVPLRNVIRNGIYIAVAISAIIGLGIVLLQIYIFRRLQLKNAGEDANATSWQQLRHQTWPGLLVVIVVTFVFSTMLLMLQSYTDATATAMTKRENIQYGIDLRKDDENTIRSSFVDSYRTRAQTLANFLTVRQDNQTRDGLEALSRIVGTEYLMRFDSAGHEIVSSNSYTGFAVGANLSEEYQAVLMGYPYAVVGPAADPYTGRMQIGVAVLMTDGEGRPDGFLLAVYGAEELTKELKRASYENTVNSFAVRKGHIAAAINDEDGRFIAHTNPEMIGQKAADYLEDYEPGTSFEGFVRYNGEQMCVSANSTDGRTLLYMVPGRGDSITKTIPALMALAVLLIMALLFYPSACALIAHAMTEAKEPQPCESPRNPLMIFSDGYAGFLTVFVIFALIASANGWWSSFDYVFSGEWSKGVHLFSLWAVLFVLAATLCCMFLIRTGLRILESRLGFQARTVVRLAGSLITYAATFFLIFCIFDILGANTTALLASAGVVSIAVGMGAQSMAADLLAGFFMLLEGSIHVGDHVTASGITGTVTDMGIRTTEITDEEGNVVSINNSKVSPVRNMSRRHPKQSQEE